MKDAQDKFLIVKRPQNDSEFPGSWGLPAVSTKPGELPEQAALRVCQEKLSCSAIPIRFIGAMFQKRANYDIVMMDIEMILDQKTKPDVKKAKTENTTYIEQRWSDKPSDLLESAKKGSCCSSIFLFDKGLLEKDDLLTEING
ncbi:NUDIX hydrolase [Candidatus Saccharibacteria bacterium]|nr:NUDIX hydrolase [Candidatus Saccharibacteria bacterium]